jgi:Uma2 family endonuclease
MKRVTFLDMVEERLSPAETQDGEPGPASGGHDEPRIGRRESEPHSEEVSYLFNVLRTSFPGSRPTWDLHHYFHVDDDEIDLRLDVSFFHGWAGPGKMSSYTATEHGGRVPDMAINILSKSTWKDDIGENVDLCRIARIPVYVIFSPYHVATKTYKPPFLRVYLLQSDGKYTYQERRAIAMKEGVDTLNWDETVDCGKGLPFRFGLMELADVHEKGWPLYRLVLLDPTSKRPLLTATEREKFRADQLEEQLRRFKTGSS